MPGVVRVLVRCHPVHVREQLEAVRRLEAVDELLDALVALEGLRVVAEECGGLFDRAKRCAGRPTRASTTQSENRTKTRFTTKQAQASKTEPSARPRRHPERALSGWRGATRPATRVRAWPGSQSMTRRGLRSGSYAGGHRPACASESWWPRRWNAALARALKRRMLLRRCVRFTTTSRCSSRTCGLLSLQAAREAADSYFSRCSRSVTHNVTHRLQSGS